MRKNWEREVASQFPNLWLTDCQSLHDYLVNPFRAGTGDKRLEIDLDGLRKYQDDKLHVVNEGLGATETIVIAKLPGGAVKRLGFRSQDGEILSQDRLVRDVVRPDELLQAYYIPTVVTRATRVSWKHTSTSSVH